MEQKTPCVSIKSLHREEFDVICFSLEAQYKDALPLKDNAKLLVYYVLHYGALYKNPRMCRESYGKEEFYKICDSNWTAQNIANDIGYLPYVVNGAINSDHFHPVEVEKKYDVLCYGTEKREWKGTKDIKKACEIAGVKLEKYDGKGIKQKDMGSEYSKAKVFVSGSNFEGWNQPGIEAMACGTPLVITDDGGSRDYAIDGYNCLVVPYNKPEQMAKAIKRVLTDKELAQRLRRNGLKTAAKFDWETTTDKFESILLNELSK
jgi:glycosyltransferase involved in cell wall biosynthesis